MEGLECSCCNTPEDIYSWVVKKGNKSVSFQATILPLNILLTTALCALVSIIAQGSIAKQPRGLLRPEYCLSVFILLLPNYIN